MKFSDRVIPPPEQLEVFLQELEPLVSKPLLEIARSLVALVAILHQLLEKKTVSLARLRRLLFGPRTEKTAGTGADPAATTSGAGRRTGRRGGSPKGKGHGRRSLKKDFPGAERIPVPHESLSAGCPCTSCGRGRYYSLTEPRSVARWFGQPFLLIRIWDLAGLRCSACQRVVWAEPPEEAKGPKYDATAQSMVAVMHYGNGMPFHRTGQHQERLGMPIAPADQWDMVNKLADTVAPAHQALIEEAARGQVVHNDDTQKKILELERARADEAAGPDNPEKPKRTGTFTTSVVSKTGEHTVALFFTGRKHAGENLNDLLARRPREDGIPIQMCDALSRNCPKNFKTLLQNCLSHGRRKFVEILSFFPAECQHVLELLKEVYATDARARRRKLSPEDRLELHQRKSGPVMEELRAYMAAQLSEQKTEPNSTLGQAFNYLLKRWKHFTLFLRVPGVPLDNNICERCLKMAIRHRKNSLFYKTIRGALVGDRMMSLIHTCQLNGVNPYAYLTALGRHAASVRAAPTAWLPWNYEESLARLKAATAEACRASRRTASSEINESDEPLTPKTKHQHHMPSFSPAQAAAAPAPA